MAFALGPRAAAGTRLEAFASIESTSSEAMVRIRAGERGPLWLVSAHQTAGRGRRNRPWIAPPGNLAASIIETFDALPSLAATLGFAAGLALHEALQGLGVEEAARGATPLFQLKWPNDLLLGGGKVAGILLEASAASERVTVVTGIGVNVVAAPTDTPYPATSLAAHGLAWTAEDVFSALSDKWTKLVSLWDNGAGFPKIRDLWLDRAAGLGEPMTIRNGESVLSGLFETIDDTGCLILKGVDGEFVSIAAGDVYFGAASSAGAS
ncbi:MAG: biotin--[acetyl-CoA-carboxylase] ligase [Bradyrhizobiaceae bacterium]|nr:MAG: biotin--[acetyl-CoA-carboxylase] ligase [Bradyrhizobiaceae bacterium]